MDVNNRQARAAANQQQGERTFMPHTVSVVPVQPIKKLSFKWSKNTPFHTGVFSETRQLRVINKKHKNEFTEAWASKADNDQRENLLKFCAQSNDGNILDAICRFFEGKEGDINHPQNIDPEIWDNIKSKALIGSAKKKKKAGIKPNFKWSANTPFHTGVFADMRQLKMINTKHINKFTEAWAIADNDQRKNLLEFYAQSGDRKFHIAIYRFFEGKEGDINHPQDIAPEIWNNITNKAKALEKNLKKKAGIKIRFKWSESTPFHTGVFSDVYQLRLINRRHENPFTEAWAIADDDQRKNLLEYCAQSDDGKIHIAIYHFFEGKEKDINHPQNIDPEIWNNIKSMALQAGIKPHFKWSANTPFHKKPFSDTSQLRLINRKHEKPFTEAWAIADNDQRKNLLEYCAQSHKSINGAICRFFAGKEGDINHPQNIDPEIWNNIKRKALLLRKKSVSFDDDNMSDMSDVDDNEEADSINNNVASNVDGHFLAGGKSVASFATVASNVGDHSLAGDESVASNVGDENANKRRRTASDDWVSLGGKRSTRSKPY